MPRWTIRKKHATQTNDIDYIVLEQQNNKYQNNRGHQQYQHKPINIFFVLKYINK